MAIDCEGQSMLGRGSVFAQVAIISTSYEQKNTLIVNSRGPLFLPFSAYLLNSFFALVALLRGLRAHRDFGVSL